MHSMQNCDLLHKWRAAVFQTGLEQLRDSYVSFDTQVAFLGLTVLARTGARIQSLCESKQKRSEMLSKHKSALQWVFKI